MRKARTRLERELRGRRRDAERLVRRGRARSARSHSRAAAANVVAEQVARVETVVQAGVDRRRALANGARERVAAIA